MATFTTNAGKAGNMLLIFAFPEFGIEGIGTVPLATPIFAANVSDFTPDLIVVYQAGMTFTGTTPTGGTFTILTLTLGGFSAGEQVGTLTGITRANNFVEIDDINNYRILDGDDTLHGNTLSDDLTGGFGGSDIFNGGGGNDRFYVAGLGVTPTHQFNGAAGSTDEIIVKVNIYSGATELNLRSSSFASIEELTLEAGVSVLLNASQFGAGGLAAGLAISGPAGSSVTIAKDNAGTLDLGGLSVTGVTVTVNGSAGADLIIGSAAGDKLFGLNAADTLRGAGGGDTLTGNGGDDTLDGGAGGDTMKGGAGSDTYMIDNAGDIVDESVGGSSGTDTVRVTFNFNLGDAAHVKGAVENLTLLGAAVTGAGNGLANTIVGNANGNTLDGAAGDDTLDGAGGADIMRGLSGNDTYVLDNVLDVVDERPAGSDGADTVLASVNVNLGSSVAKLVSLAPAASGLGAVENITLTGGAVEATGNDLANVITGNVVGNRLVGGLGADQFSGAGGADSFLFFSVKDSGKKASARDTILDFTAGDLIDLSFIDAKKGGKDNKFKFIGKKSFSEEKGELHFQRKDGDVIVSGDVNGDGKADFAILLDAVSKVAKADFVL